MKTIKRLGLEKEFKKWMKDIKRDWKIGSRVELVEDLKYSPFAYGDKGKVVDIQEDYGGTGKHMLKIKFDKLNDTTTLWSYRFKLIE